MPDAESSPQRARSGSTTTASLDAVPLAAILPGIEGFVFLLDDDGRLHDVRVGTAGELFVSPDMFIGRTLAEVLPAEVVPPLLRAIQESAPGRATTAEYALPFADGVRMFEATFTRLAGDFTLAVVAHVTRRARAERELAHLDARLREAIRIGEIGIFDHDHATNDIFWSPELRAIFGWDADEPVAIPKILSHTHPEHTAQMAEVMRRGLDPAGDGRFDVEHRITRRDGEVRWILMRSRTRFTGEGASRRPARTVGAVADVTAHHVEAEARAAAERRARETEERFRTLLDQGLDILATCDAAGRVTYVSPAVESTLGYTPAELLGVPLVELMHADDQGIFGAILQRLSQTPRGTQRATTRVRHKDGHYRVLEGLGRNLLDHPDVCAIVINARDLTEQRRLEEQLQQADRLDGIGRLAGGVAHDLNNILTVVLGYVEFLRDSIESGSRPAASDVSEIESAAGRARALVTQLLAFARRQVIAPRVEDLNAVVARSTRILDRMLGEQITLRLSLAPSLWPVLIDALQIEQVMLNLTINARDAMPGGGTLSIATANVALPAPQGGLETGDYVELVVADTGNGIPPSMVSHIFEPFFTTKGPGAGTGLGLSTVYGIVRQNRGDIAVQSAVGVGTTFTIRLPRFLAAETALVTPAASTAASEPTGH